jgi:hypothetical protein
MSDEFVVNDKRLFGKDGTVNESAAEKAPGASGDKAAADVPGWDEPCGPPGKEAKRPGGPLPPANLPSLLAGLATSAFIHLGEGPEAGKEAPDLEAAKHAIDLLGVLQTKTRGNLEREEEELLTALLYDLRMKYVAACQKNK